MSVTQEFVQRFVNNNPELAADHVGAVDLNAIAAGEQPKKVLRVPVMAHLVIGVLLAFAFAFAILIVVDPPWLRQNLPEPANDKERWEQRAQRAGAVAFGVALIYLLFWWLVGSTIIHRRRAEETESHWKRLLL